MEQMAGAVHDNDFSFHAPGVSYINKGFVLGGVGQHSNIFNSITEVCPDRSSQMFLTRRLASSLK